MTTGSTQLPPAMLREIQCVLLGASDDQLARVVGLLDGLDGRGSADALIAPFRFRVAQLRPTRPLTFARLLFTPLDPLVMPGPAWSRGRLGLPRTALLPLTGQVRAELGGLTAEVDAMIRGGHTGDMALVLRAGTVLWPAAAAVLERAGAPAGWSTATGLSTAEHAAIARCAACVLAEGVWIHTRMRDFAEGLGPDPDELRVWLEAAMCRRAEPSGALMAVLMARLPGAASLIGPAGAQPARGVGPTEQVIDFLLDRLQAVPPHGADPAETSIAVQRAVTLLDMLDAPGPGQRPSRKPRVEQLRRMLDEGCRARFTEDLARQVLAPMADTAAPGEMTSLEEAARGLRRLETAGRQLGSGEQYDRMLRAAARSIGETGQRSLVERARLVEILAGPDAALALLQG